MKKIKQNQEYKLSNIHPSLLVDLLKDLGHNQQAIFDDIQLEPEQTTTPDLEVTYQQYVELITKAVALTNNPSIGLHFGEKINFTGHGIFGIGGLASENLMESIEFAHKAALILNPGIGYETHQDESFFHLEIVERLPWEGLDAYMVDTTFAMIGGLIQNVLRDTDLEIKYQFRYEAGSHQKDYERVLGPALTFSGERNCVSFPIKIATSPSPWRNPVVAQQVSHQLTENLKQKHQDQNKLIAPIKTMLFEKPGRIPTLDAIADHFNLSPRTLSRRLKTLNTSYNDILNEERKKLALQYMNDPDYSVDKIAYLLGYNNSSNFSKAFKAWTTHTPRDYRKNILNQ